MTIEDLRQLSRRRTLRVGSSLLGLGALVSAGLALARPLGLTGPGTPGGALWLHAVNGCDGHGHRVVAAPSTFVDECRNLATVWPGLTLLLVALGASSVALALVGERLRDAWACDKPNGRLFLLSGALGLVLIVGSALAGFLFVAIAGP